MNRPALMAVAILSPALLSGCLASMFSQDGCAAVLMGNPREASALLKICDYAFQLDDANDAIVVKALGTTPDSWRSHHLSWKDIAVEARNTTLRVAFQSIADSSTGIDVPIGDSARLGALKEGSIELDEFLTICEVAGGEHEVRFRFYQAAEDRWDSVGGVIEIAWTDVREC